MTSLKNNLNDSLIFQPNMLGYYHPKNGGIMTIHSQIWFDQNTQWYNEVLVASGIQRIKNSFMIKEIPDKPDGKYKLCGMMRGCLYLNGSNPIICRII